MSDKKQSEKERRIAVLSRYPGQKVIVGDTVFRILKIDGQRISVFIEAPAELEIKRQSKEQDQIDRIYPSEGVKKKR